MKVNVREQTLALVDVNDSAYIVGSWLVEQDRSGSPKVSYAYHITDYDNYDVDSTFTYGLVDGMPIGLVD